MGLFCANLHFRTTDDKALSASLNRRGVTRYRVVPAKGEWTSLYEERASQQDDGRVRDLAGGLSEDLHVAAIAFLVHDSDVACYWLFDGGRLLDEYNSCPDYFETAAMGAERKTIAHLQPETLEQDVALDRAALALETEDLPRFLARQVTLVDEQGPELPLGLGGIAVATADGLSDVLYLMIDDLPSVSDGTHNHSPGTATEISLPTAIDGQCDGTLSDYFRFTAQAGERISCEVVATRLAWDFDPLVRVLDAAQRSMAHGGTLVSVAGSSAGRTA